MNNSIFTTSTPVTTLDNLSNNSSLQKAYKKYQLQWMMDHGCSMDDFVKYLSKTFESGNYSKLDDCYYDWEMDSGFGGCCWACFDEWLEEEAPKMFDITREIIEKAYWKGILKITGENPEDPESDIICRIGEHWFYFGGSESNEEGYQEYMKNVTLDTLFNEILETLVDFKEDFSDEYLYYYFYMTENM